MYQFDVYDLLLFYKFFSARIIQLTSFFISIFGCLLIKYGLSIIPFFIDAHIYEFFFFVNIPYFIFIILLNIVFFTFRCLRLMNDELNLWGFGLVIIEVYISIFGLITNILNDIMIFYNISFYQTKSNKNPKKFPILVKKQLNSTKIILPIILFIWINILYLSITDCILINFKINCSYYTYKLVLNEENKISNENKTKIEPKKKKPKKPKSNQAPNDKKNKKQNNDLKDSVFKLNDDNNLNEDLTKKEEVKN